MIVYLDNSSTTRQYDDVTNTVIKQMEKNYGNPSSLHNLGVDSEKTIKDARRIIAGVLKAEPSEIFFTSGGTESDNMAIVKGAISKRRLGNKIITTKVEHPAILEPCRYMEKEKFEVAYIDVDENGKIDMEQLKEEIDDKTVLISVMHVNNELGTINPIEEIAKLKRNAFFHSDAVQSFGKIKIDTKGVGIDMLSISAHKIHGPKGVGAIYIRRGTNIQPLLLGGGQEKNMRSGTENEPCIAGFGKAAEIAQSNFNGRIEKIKKARTYLLDGIKDRIGDIRINSPEEGCPAILNISFMGVRGEVLLHMLEDSGIYVSTGSACSSNKNGRSHVLKAIGLSEKEIEGAIRFSFNEFNTVEEMDYVLKHLEEGVKRFRKMGTFR